MFIAIKWTRQGTRISPCGAVDRPVDLGEQVGRQWTGFGYVDAFSELGAALDTQDQSVDRR
jgi:hypothetical protein